MVPNISFDSKKRKTNKNIDLFIYQGRGHSYIQPMDKNAADGNLGTWSTIYLASQASYMIIDGLYH